MIDLDCLLHGNPTWEQVVAFWKGEGFPEEQYTVAAIEKHLLTEEQRQLMFAHRLTIEKMLNGRYGDGEIGKAVQSIYDAWNAKLGYKSFGS